MFKQNPENITNRHIAKVLSMLERDGAKLTAEDKKVIKNGMRYLSEDIINSKGTNDEQNYNR
jgi:hypothetical protein